MSATIDFDPKKIIRETANETIMQSQRGNDCKIIAIGSVLNWLYDNGEIKQKPLPARFRAKNPEEKKLKTKEPLSLRQLAKKKLKERDSKDSVTEAISDPTLLVKIAKYHPEIAADYLECKEEAHYINVLKKAIGDGLTPIVFFDVNDKTSQPGDQYWGTHEHSAIVTAYQEKGTRTLFTIVHWGEKIIVDGQALFKSSLKLREKREMEIYYKYKDRGDEKGRGWLPVFQIAELLLGMDRFKCDNEGYKKRIAPEISAEDNHGGLKGKILLITSQEKENVINTLKEDKLKESKRLKIEPAPKIDPKSQPWSWSKGLLWLLGLASLYSIAHSATVLISSTTLLGLSIATASWVLMFGLAALMIVAILAANCYKTERSLPECSSIQTRAAKSELLNNRADYQRPTKKGREGHVNLLGNQMKKDI